MTGAWVFATTCTTQTLRPTSPRRPLLVAARHPRFRADRQKRRVSRLLSSTGDGRTLTVMNAIEFDVERTIHAPIDQVYARLIDIDGHNDWMAGTKSMLKHTRQSSPGAPTVGTTYVDETSQGTMPGEIAELQAPRTVVFHWWEKSKKGNLTFEGWPSYHLQPSGDDETSVRHHAKLVVHGVWRLGTPIWRRLAVRERTITLEALKASFEPR